MGTTQNEQYLLSYLSKTRIIIKQTISYKYKINAVKNQINQKLNGSSYITTMKCFAQLMQVKHNLMHEKNPTAFNPEHKTSLNTYIWQSKS